MKNRLYILTGINAVLISIAVFFLYKSEPTYINNVSRPLEVWDYVSAYDADPYGQKNGKALDGVVIQMDDSTFSIRYKAGFTDTNAGGIYTFSKTHPYRIIGKGTFYHKANAYVGFNIMFITTLIFVIMALVILVAQIEIVRTLIYDKYD